MRWSEVSKERKRLGQKTKLAGSLSVKVSFDRTKPTLILYDNTSFIELKEREIEALKEYLTNETY